MSGPRLPRALLEAEVSIAALAGTSARAGQTYADPITRRAHVERRTRLVVDDRPDSETRGQEVTATVLVVTQVDDYAAPGSRITVDGVALQVIMAAPHRHPRAPQHAEHWLG